MDFGKRLRELREQKSMTQKDLAEKIGLARTEISMYETGARYPAKTNYKKLISAFNVSEKELPYIQHTNKELKAEIARLKKQIDVLTGETEEISIKKLKEDSGWEYNENILKNKINEIIDFLEV